MWKNKPYRRSEHRRKLQKVDIETYYFLCYNTL